MWRACASQMLTVHLTLPQKTLEGYYGHVKAKDDRSALTLSDELTSE